MKELSIEEKAKRYDEALERSKKVHNCEANDREPGTSICEYIFPELRELEDERIIHSLKEIVTYAFSKKENEVLVSVDGLKKDDLIEWLEKQAEPKPVEWHREDEQNLNACLGYIPDEFLRRWLTDVIHTKYDKTAWSEEDEGIVKELTDFCIKCSQGSTVVNSQNDFTRWTTWLKSLKPQKKWKPSDE